eukprot:CAMPEP_0182448102 /NCGR_PEP_ID=MMETSP1172-20130603/23673_1 /TAXON_ID=708627 /ORGANISM="Timspurckia oligopyrenoides, Strain CCMP3278" /LENGTH=158 /DNA_ID=CAMNT_0024644833 /DNA_START=697 /DNA_END=1173 /DNA_ORIENTATION=+
MLKADGLMLLSSVFYAFHVIRLSEWSSKLKNENVSSIELARIKSSCQLIFAAISVCVRYEQISTFPFLLESILSSPTSIVALFWLGFGTTALPTIAQTFGQRNTNSVTAAVIYGAQPLCAALLASFTFHEELSTFVFPAAALIMIATALISTVTSTQE